VLSIGVMKRRKTNKLLDRQGAQEQKRGQAAALGGKVASRFPLLDLPIDIIPFHILMHLPKIDVGRFLRVSLKCFELAENTLLWKALFVRDFSKYLVNTKSVSAPKLQLGMINRFNIHWKEYYYCMCTKANNPDLKWDNLKQLKYEERMDHIQSVLSLSDTRFHNVVWESTVLEIVSKHDFANPWTPEVYCRSAFADGTRFRTISQDCTYLSWSPILSGDVISSAGRLVSSNPLTVLHSEQYCPPPIIKKGLTILDIKWSGWVLMILLFLLPFVYKFSNHMGFETWPDPDQPFFNETSTNSSNTTAYSSGSTSISFYNTTSMTYQTGHFEAHASHQPEIMLTNSFVVFIQKSELWVWFLFSISALWINIRKYKKNLMPLLHLAIPPVPWPFHWITRLNQYTFAQLILFAYSIGLVLPLAFPGPFQTNISRFFLLGLLLSMSLRFRVRETDLIPIMNIYLVFAASAVLMNIHYCWWGTLKQLFGAGLITLYFVVFLPQSGLQYSRHIQKWEYLGGAIGVVLAYFLGSFGIAWIVAKWIFYEAAAVFVALPLLLMWDLHHIA